MENGRGRKRLGSAARFSLVGCKYPPPLPPRQEEELERKKETLMLFPLLYSFSHFSSVFPFASATRHSIPLYTSSFSSPFSSFFFKIFHLRVTPSFHFYPSCIFDLGFLFFFFFPSIPVVLLVFLLLEAFYPLFTLLVLFFILYSCLLPHTAFSYSFCLLTSISFILILTYHYWSRVLLIYS